MAIDSNMITQHASLELEGIDGWLDGRMCWGLYVSGFFTLDYWLNLQSSSPLIDSAMDLSIHSYYLLSSRITANYPLFPRNEKI